MFQFELKMKQTSEGIQGVVNFFRDRIIQETENSKFFASKLHKCGLGFLNKEEINEFNENKKKNNNFELFEPKSSNFSLLVQTLNKIDKKHSEKGKDIKDFCFALENNIIKEFIDKPNVALTNNFNHFKDNINKLKTQISKNILESEEKYKNFLKVFNEMVYSSKIGKKKKFNKDL